MNKIIVENVDEIKRYFPSNSYILTDTNIKKLYPSLFLSRHITIKPGESSKCLATIEMIAKKMASAGVDRNTTILAIGGGLVGDIAGFVASIYMRGIKWINIPTTILSIADSSIGGKTGVNIQPYRNLVGSFTQPECIILCKDFIKTLKEQDKKSGIGEIVKTALLHKPLFDLIKEKGINDDNIFDFSLLASKYKESITNEDFTEKGLRKVLNAGHTIGHVLESLDGYKLGHGEYVLFGLILELNAFKDKNEYYDEMISFVNKYSIKGFSLPELSKVASLASADKKNVDGKISIMIPQFCGAKEELISIQEFINRFKKIW